METSHPALCTLPDAVTGNKAAGSSLADTIRDIQQRLGCKSVLDIGAGAGDLLRELRRQGVVCGGVNLCPDPSMAISEFNLSAFQDETQISEARSALPYSAFPTLTTCAHTLEQLRREDITNALWNLRKISDEWIFVSVKTGPSSNYNSKHLTVLPKSAWASLFSALGLRICDTFFQGQFSDQIESFDDDEQWSVNHWQRLDVYRDEHERGHHCFLLQKDLQVTPSLENFEAEVSRLLGLSSDRNAPRIGAKTFISFLLGHYQEFLLFEPFFQALPTSSFRVLMRSGAFDGFEGHRRGSILAFFAARGIEVDQVDSVESLRWSLPEGKENHALVTAIDSTACYSHLVNSAFLLAARDRGIPTFQLQHGIWPHAQFTEPLTVFADYLLTWSNDFERPFLLETASQSTPGTSSASRHTVLQIGCPRFDTYSDNRTASVAELLGEWAGAYRKSVFLATNLHWPLHAKGSAVLPQLAKSACELPDVLFICKLHPAHDYDPIAFEQMPENVVIIDEFVSLYANLSTPRLIKASDATVCTLSTVALEAALAKKPVLVLETENPNKYVGLETIAIESLTTALRQVLNESTDANENFLRNYYSPRHDFGALQDTLTAIDESFSLERSPRSASDIAVSSFANCFLKEMEVRHTAGLETERLVRELATTHELLVQQSKTTSNEMANREQPPVAPVQVSPIQDTTVAITAPESDNQGSVKPQLNTMNKIRREVLRVVHQVKGKVASTIVTHDESPVPVATSGAAACTNQAPAESHVIGEPEVQKPTRSAEIIAVQELEPLTLGSLHTRDQFPQLLNQLGLTNFAVELGVAAASYSDYILANSNVRVLFSVDRWSDHHNDYECEYARNLLSRHSVRSSVLRMTFDEAVKIFADGTFDFIYIDGYAHTGQDGISTLDAWWPKLAPGGMFAGHDYDSNWPKTIEVVDQFIAKHSLQLYTTKEDPTLVEHAYPSWYTFKPKTVLVSSC